MRYDTIITNGTIVNANKTEKADVAIRGEKIARVGKGLAKNAGANGTRVIDAKGCYVIPGAMDVHVHLELPFCGTVSSDDYDSGTKAAARGGVTTVIDFAIPYGKESLQQAVDNWMAKADGKACVDYTFHVAITKWDRHKKEMAKIVRQGLPTFKEFMIYEKEGWQSDDRAIFGALEKCRELGAMLLIHAESSRVLDELIDRHHNAKEMKKLGAQLHGITRPNFIEAEAIQRAVKWAEVTGGKLYIVHMSTAEGTDIIADAHRRGLRNVYAETCAQYLVLDDSLFKGKDGHLYGCCPQIKKPADQARLWKGLKRDTVCVVSTDTCTFTRKQKAMWKGDWTKIPMGMPGLETLVPIVYTHGVLKKRMTVKEFVDKCCTSPARIMGLGDRKGVIKKGYDADIAVIHPTKKIKVDHRKLETNADWSPYQGWPLAGFSRTTLSRGKVIVDNYKFCGRNGWGKFLKRKTAGNL
ncbi:MAG: dihydropyrimidinase [Phycisphaerales bacterium]|nr:dihydropyrimidinase [Phycisphaerales bacterium]